MLKLVLLLVALLSSTAWAFRKHHGKNDVGTSKFGVDDDDTDASDVAGRVAFNKANQLRELLQSKVHRATHLCPYWPRSEYIACYNMCVRCALNLLATGELADHVKLSPAQCVTTGTFGTAAANAQVSENLIWKYFINHEKDVKKICKPGDDVCKNNVECQIMHEVAQVYPNTVTLVNCPKTITLDSHIGDWLPDHNPHDRALFPNPNVNQTTGELFAEDDDNSDDDDDVDKRRKLRHRLRHHHRNN